MTVTTAGPGDYNSEHFCGNKNIRQAYVKAAPQFSFSKSMTHRLLPGDTAHQSKMTTTPRNDAGNVHLEAGYNAYNH